MSAIGDQQVTFWSLTNIIIDAAYALRSKFHLSLYHINLRLLI